MFVAWLAQHIVISVERAVEDWGVYCVYSWEWKFNLIFLFHSQWNRWRPKWPPTSWHMVRVVHTLNFLRVTMAENSFFFVWQVTFNINKYCKHNYCPCQTFNCKPNWKDLLSGMKNWLWLYNGFIHYVLQCEYYHYRDEVAFWPYISALNCPDCRSSLFSSIYFCAKIMEHVLTGNERL